MLIAFEGIDGSGKGTQALLLDRRLTLNRRESDVISFPTYQCEPFGPMIAKYLNGGFGENSKVPPELIAMMYAADRHVSRDFVRYKSSDGKVLICDRYVLSNMGHQASKLPLELQSQFVNWLATVEYDVFKMPRADLTVFLDMPVEVAVTLIAKKSKRSYTDLKADIHESDSQYLKACRESYGLSFWTVAPGDLVVIKCCRDDGSLRDPEEIHEEVWQACWKWIGN